MIKTAFATVIVAVMASTSAFAAADCIGKYDDFWTKMNQYGNAKPTTENVVAVNRAALRAYDACQSGDETSVKEFWDKMSQYGNSKDDAKKFFEELAQYGNAK